MENINVKIKKSKEEYIEDINTYLIGYKNKQIQDIRFIMYTAIICFSFIGFFLYCFPIKLSLCILIITGYILVVILNLYVRYIINKQKYIQKQEKLIQSLNKEISYYTNVILNLEDIKQENGYVTLYYLSDSILKQVDCQICNNEKRTDFKNKTLLIDFDYIENVDSFYKYYTLVEPYQSKK